MMWLMWLTSRRGPATVGRGVSRVPKDTGALGVKSGLQASSSVIHLLIKGYPVGSGGRTQRQTCSGRRPEHDCRWRRFTEPSALPGNRSLCTGSRRVKGHTSLIYEGLAHGHTHPLNPARQPLHVSCACTGLGSTVAYRLTISSRLFVLQP